jgi:hypothetical protein
MRRLVTPALLVVLTASPSARGTEIEFTAESPEFAVATEEYRAIWKADGDRIANALQQETGLLLESGPMRAIVFEGVSSSGYHEDPMAPARQLSSGHQAGDPRA